MYSRNYLSPNNDEQSVYRMGHKEYTRIKSWLASTSQNQSPQPQPQSQLQPFSPTFQYIPLNYILSFRRITLSQSFLNKHLRTLNSSTANGLRILAGVQDKTRNIYLGKLYERKEILCNFDVLTGSIVCLEEVVLGFYGFQERVAGGLGNLGVSMGRFEVVVELQVVSGKGESFGIGAVRHCLADRLKQAVVDVEMVKIGEQEKTGHIQLHIDTPQKLGLSYFLPPNTLIDPSTKLPPLKSLTLKPPTSTSTPTPYPFTLYPSYPISLQNLQIKINNYNTLLKALRNCSPYFNDYHHQNTGMEVVRVGLVVGFHNGWMVLRDLPGGGGGKDREKQSPRHGLAVKNVSKVVNSYIDPRELKTSLAPNLVSNPIKLTQTSQDQNSITLQPEQPPKPQQSLFLLNDRPKQQKQPINLLYFDCDQGQLIAILQFTLKFKLDSTIKQERTVKTTVFWAPITFNIGQPSCQVRIPMIEHIKLPGYPIEWNRLHKNKQISTQLSYRCINQNPELHKSVKKQRLNSYSNIRQYTDRDRGDYVDMLLEDEDEEEEAVKGVVKTQMRLMTNTSFVTNKKEEANLKIQRMLRRLEKTLKPKLRIQQSKYTHQLTQTPIHSQPKTKGLSLINKSYLINLHLQSFLPLPSNPSQFYIPRTLSLTLYILRHKFHIIAHITRQSAKAGIPIQLQNPSKMDYQGFRFQVRVEGITEDQAGAIEEGSCIVVEVQDGENWMYYGGGAWPVLGLFEEDGEQGSQNGENGEKLKFIRIQLRSKMTPTGNTSLGFLLLSTSTLPLPQTPQKPHPPQIPLSTALPHLPTKQRQLLRIHTFTGNPQSPLTHHQTIKAYKQSNLSSYANELTRTQLGNDLELEYQIGRASYGWLRVCNTDVSGNNVFGFWLDCEVVELVMDKSEYQRNVMMFMKSNPKEKAKVMPNLSYILGKQGSSGYYQAKIPQGTQADILIKVLNSEYDKSIKQTTIATIEVKRNTLFFSKFKIRLNFKKPLIDRIYRLEILWTNTSTNETKVRLPDYIFEDNGEYIGTLTANTLYNPKQKTISLADITEDTVGQIGALIDVLLGVYFDKSLQYVRSTILVQVQLMQGERVRVGLGELQVVKVPLCGEGFGVKDRVYRVETSSDQYRLMGNNVAKLFYYSELQKNEPELSIRCLRPKKDNLTVCIISLQNKLLKKYLLQLECSIPPNCKLEKPQIEGYIGQKLILILQNPYHIDYGFYLSSTTPNLIFKNLEFQKNNKEQFIFKLKGRSPMRITVQVVGDLQSCQYIVLSDCNHCVISIFEIRKIDKVKEIVDVMGKGLISGGRFGIGSQDGVVESETSLMDGSKPAFFGVTQHKKVYM